MDKNIKVTIGLPVYNCEQTIELTIKSILDQTYKNFELIITDDGSTDNSIEIIKEFNDPRIKLYKDGINKGISYRLNQQIDLAVGDYFMRMDADDLMFPNRIEKQVDYLEKNKDVDVLGSFAVVIDDENKILGIRKSELKKDNKFLESTVFIHPTVCGRIEWFKKLKYKDKFKGVEDLDLWIRGQANSNYKVIKEPLIFYRDSLIFKPSTYRFRQNQLRNLCTYNQIQYPTLKRQFQKIKLKSYIKEYIALVLYYLYASKWFIGRRNENLSNCNEYNRTLNNIII